MDSDFAENPDYIRATWMLQWQIQNVDDLVRFWKLLGPPLTGNNEVWFSL